MLSIIVGSFGGLEQKKLKSLLAYSSIGHMGYTLIAFSTGTFEGMQILFCYLFLYMVAGLCIWSIFLTLQLKYKYTKKQNKDLADLNLLSKSNNILALFFSTVLLSIAGLPPMIGFLVKIGIFLVSIEASMYLIAIISILCSVISTFYYIRIIKTMYFESSIAGKLYYPIKSNISILIVCLFYFLLFLFINPTLVYLISHKIILLLTMSMF
jgi:NADH-quinone oxidoreductase subunit N